MPCFLDSYLITKYTSILLECIVLWRGLLFLYKKYYLHNHIYEIVFRFNKYEGKNRR